MVKKRPRAPARMQLRAMAMARWLLPPEPVEGAGSPDQHGVALLGQERAAGEAADKRLVDRRGLEHEVVDVLGQRQLGDGELILDRARLLFGDLGAQQVADEALRFVLTLQRDGQRLVIGRLHAVELQLAHHVEHFGPFHGSGAPIARQRRAFFRTPYEAVVAGAIGDRRVAERQRRRGLDRRRRPRITAARENVEDDVGGVDAFGQRLGAGGLDRRQPVGEHGGQDFDHLPVAVVGARELAPHPLQRRRQHPVLERRPLRKAPGLRASTGT